MAVVDKVFNCLMLVFDDSSNAATYCLYQLIEYPYWLEVTAITAFIFGLAFLVWARWLGKREEENARKAKRKTCKSRGPL